MIRVGFFEDFRGADTLLIDVDVDAEGLRGLIAWLRDVISSGRKVGPSDVDRRSRFVVKVVGVPITQYP